MLSPSQQAHTNLEDARRLRADGQSYRQIGRRLGLSSGQLGHIRRALKREKAARTRLRSRAPDATDRDLPVAQSILPAGLRRGLVAAGYRTLERPPGLEFTAFPAALLANDALVSIPSQS